MHHHLQSAEIRQMYDLLYKYERRLDTIKQKDSISIADLDIFLQTNDIYIDVINKANEIKAVTHNGYILFGQAQKAERDYWLIRHLRNAFAHGFVEFNKKNGRVCFKDGKKKIKCEIPRQLVIPLFQHLNKAS